MTNNTDDQGLCMAEKTPAETLKTRILRLPNELLLAIFGSLLPHDLFPISQTCRRFRVLTVRNWETEVTSYAETVYKGTELGFWKGMQTHMHNNWYCYDCGRLHHLAECLVPLSTSSSMFEDLISATWQQIPGQREGGSQCPYLAAAEESIRSCPIPKGITGLSWRCSTLRNKLTRVQEPSRLEVWLVSVEAPNDVLSTFPVCPHFRFDVHATLRYFQSLTTKYPQGHYHIGPRTCQDCSTRCVVSMTPGWEGHYSLSFWINLGTHLE
ncbi:hypothetical protein B0I35DRAFT_221839 [Stachybotrys elegans]|uniref:F-box domain-containing protein n=1 Tax=Stachybotrys elegans TaxID=80388 RepID=A0A8K0WR70_9HYPO|nr:hypothetical protein B0I35DRAFT_221839 [Stachybotrys elegans]